MGSFCSSGVPRSRPSLSREEKSSESYIHYKDQHYRQLFERGLSLSALSSIKVKYISLREEFKPDSLDVDDELLKYINLQFFRNTQENDAAGTVNIYICSTPEQDLCSLIDCIAGWEAYHKAKDKKKFKKFYYWVERLCLTDPEYSKDLNNRKILLQKAKMVVLLLPNWSNFRPLNQADSLLDIFSVTQMEGTQFDVFFPIEETAEFEKSFSDYKTFLGIMKLIKNTANFQKAVDDLRGVRNPQYHTHINHSSKINMLVFQAFKSWFFERIKDFAEKAIAWPIIHRYSSEEKEEGNKAWSLFYVAGLCTRESGEFNESVKFLSRAVEQSNDKKQLSALKLDLALSLAQDKHYGKAEKILHELLSFPAQFSEERLIQAKLTAAECHIAKGDLHLARNTLKLKQLTSENSALGARAMTLMADLDSREGNYIEAEYRFRRVIRPVEQPTPMGADASNSNALNVLTFVEHLIRKLCDSNLSRADHEKALMEARGYFKKLADLVMILIDTNGERHHHSKRAADMLVELTLRVNPKQLEKRYLNRDCGMMRTWSETPLRSKNSIVVLHWNILADSLAYGDLVKNGFACDDSVLSWKNNRRDKIIIEILKYDPDVFSLVECDRYDDLHSVFSRFGYDSVWLKKNRDFYKDGGAIFWKRHRFQKVDELHTPLKKNNKNADQVLVSVKLVELGNVKNSFAVGCVHLKSAKKASGEESRLDQAKQVVNLYEQQYGDVPWILLADLNGESGENVTRNYQPKAYPFLVDSVFQSAYKQVLGAEPDFTSWKVRAGDVFRYTIDFVFHTKDIVAKSVLGMPSEDQIDPNLLLPSMKNPSDHLPLVTELEMSWD